MSAKVEMMGQGTSLEGISLQEYQEAQQKYEEQYATFGTVAALAFAGAGLLYLCFGMVMPLFLVVAGVFLVMGVTNCFGY